MCRRCRHHTNIHTHTHTHTFRHEKKKQMANIIELSNQAYESRDQGQMEVAAIQQANAKEGQDYEDQIKVLNEQLEADKRRKDFAVGGGGDGEGQRGDMTMEQEAALKRKVAKGVWGIAKDKAGVQSSLDRVQSYEDAFNKIKAATGISDINELVSTFISNEDQNFSLFNYVNEQNNEIEKLEEHLQSLHDEESKYTQESGEDVNQHKQLLNELAQKLQNTEATAEKYEHRYQDALKTINSLKVRSFSSSLLPFSCSSLLLFSSSSLLLFFSSYATPLLHIR